MNKVNALTLRQSLGKVLKLLDKTGDPILIEKGREARAVLISIRDFQERFVDKRAAAEREALVKQIHNIRSQSKNTESKSAMDILRELRGPLT